MRYWVIAATLALLAGTSNTSDAQVVPHAVYYQAPTTYVQPVVAYRPVLRPTTVVVNPAVPVTYVPPQPVVVARPTVPVLVPQPVWAPAPAVTTTRYRPILGGTVTRTWYP